MRLRSLIAAMALLGAAAAPGMATAATVAVAAYDGTTNMRAGPGTNFPVIARILAGSRVNVIGCLSNFSWCDVVVQNYRGWVSTSRLELAYASRRRTPVIGFSFDYWDNHYSHRPWYHQWHQQHRPNRQLPDLEPDPGPTEIYPDPQPTDIYPDPEVIYPDQGAELFPDQGAGVIYPDQGGGGWDGGGSEVMPDSQMGACPPSNDACR